jgi:hypothetical protein
MLIAVVGLLGGVVNKMDNVINIRKYISDKTGLGFDVCSVSEFINEMNGPGFDDEEYQIVIGQFNDEQDQLLGWTIRFWNAEEGIMCFVALDNYKGPDNFEFKVGTLDEIVAILNSLDHCGRGAVIEFEHNDGG